MLIKCSVGPGNDPALYETGRSTAPSCIDFQIIQLPPTKATIATVTYIERSTNLGKKYICQSWICRQDRVLLQDYLAYRAVFINH